MVAELERYNDEEVDEARKQKVEEEVEEWLICDDVHVEDDYVHALDKGTRHGDQCTDIDASASHKVVQVVRWIHHQKENLLTY